MDEIIAVTKGIKYAGKDLQQENDVHEELMGTLEKEVQRAQMHFVDR